MENKVNEVDVIVFCNSNVKIKIVYNRKDRKGGETKVGDEIPHKGKHTD